jgi:hypothetical protein
MLNFVYEDDIKIKNKYFAKMLGLHIYPIKPSPGLPSLMRLSLKVVKFLLKITKKCIFPLKLPCPWIRIPNTDPDHKVTESGSNPDPQPCLNVLRSMRLIWTPTALSKSWAMANLRDRAMSRHVEPSGFGGSMANELNRNTKYISFSFIPGVTLDGGQDTKTQWALRLTLEWLGLAKISNADCFEFAFDWRLDPDMHSDCLIAPRRRKKAKMKMKGRTKS